mgnify:CR=1 FL=1|jgi:hypothetical protein
MALRQGLEALSQGLLRQADIGGRAYEDAARKEAERRAESRALSAERRALIQQKDAETRRAAEWDRQQLSLEETTKRSELRGDTRFTQRLKEEGIARLNLEDEMITKRYDSWFKQYKIESAAKIEAAKGSAKITALKLRYEKAQSAYESLVKEFGADPSGEGFKYAYRAQQDALQAWNDFSQASGLKMQVNPEIDRLRIRTVQAVYAEIMSADLVDEGPFNDFIKALEQGYGPGSDYGSGTEPNKASEDAMKTINDAIERLGITLPAEEKSAMVDDLVKAFLANPDVREGTVTIDPGDGGEVIDVNRTGPAPEQAANNAAMNALKERSPKLYFLARQAGATTADQLNDPVWLMSLLTKERERLVNLEPSQPIGSMAGRVDIRTGKPYPAHPAITNFEETKAEALREIDALIEELKPSLPNEEAGMLNSGRGMINAIDQGIPAEALAYWEPDVADARAKAMQGTA